MARKAELIKGEIWKRGILVAASFLVLLLLINLLVALETWWVPSLDAHMQSDRELHEAQADTRRVREAYTQWTFHERQQAFSWQARSTRVMFWVSMIVSLAGIAFSFWQFAGASAEARLAADVDELEVKTEMVSLAFKSRSIAALVLFISTLYLLLYALLIYPINEAASAEGANVVPRVTVVDRPQIPPEVKNEAGNQPPNGSER